MKVFIRHAEKAYPNGNGNSLTDKKHDPPLTENGRKASIEKAKELVTLFGFPTRIISSPYRRCRETAESLLEGLKRIGDSKDCREGGASKGREESKESRGYEESKECEKEIDIRVAEYLGNHNNIDLDITNETASFNIKHPETWRQFNVRINNYVKEIKTESKGKGDGECKESKGEIIWIVTHGVVIQTICKLLKNNYKKKNYEYLEIEIYPENI